MKWLKHNVRTFETTGQAATFIKELLDQRVLYVAPSVNGKTVWWDELVEEP